MIRKIGVVGVFLTALSWSSWAFVANPTTVRSVSLGAKKDDAWKEEMWQEQQKMLKRRRSGEQNKQYFQAVAQRRKDATEALRKKEEARERGDVPPLKNNLGPDGVERKGGIPVPIASFGLPMYDQGERFDLRSKYVENPKVDDAADWKNVFFGSANKKKTSSSDKKQSASEKTSSGRAAFRWPWEQ
mmetsp:Transcript_30615/g.93576  ORF Transcript_30615/g.93576 Transcript_30615/m.93576 type:complete len:187 (-) Transcript_30615:68-628(-)|eukprot:CAMPEP_0198657088 /NCGR_PEP_ID=MMETSP1467-20131203/11296_1 /TAXON_ID=1462469 /ORGANISM="unid. sp., Strain CCMP2135" /LENGTH=186 /DNA_ID=CAMNT_0044393179 /DNA_START=26 /DNA_END=586 /DNA_ORIENTATION=+